MITPRPGQWLLPQTVMLMVFAALLSIASGAASGREALVGVQGFVTYV